VYIMSKRVFVSHPTTGDTQENNEKIVAICHEIYSDVIRPQAVLVNFREYLLYGPIDELWLYGSLISIEMWDDIRAAREVGTLVVAKSPETKMFLMRQMS
jgi:hypothetical protein